MSGFDPGYGWRQTSVRGAAHHETVVYYPEGDAAGTWWVREEPVPPVPPLPTEPYTVIRVTWKKNGTEVMTLVQSGVWLGGGYTYGPAALAGWVIGFEVLARPVTQ